MLITALSINIMGGQQLSGSLMLHREKPNDNSDFVSVFWILILKESKMGTVNAFFYREIPSSHSLHTSGLAFNTPP
jgi:hypothetical protein